MNQQTLSEPGKDADHATDAGPPKNGAAPPPKIPDNGAQQVTIRKAERVVVGFTDLDIETLSVDILSTRYEWIAQLVSQWAPSGRLDQPDKIEIVASIEVHCAIPSHMTAEQVAAELRELVAQRQKTRIEGQLRGIGEQPELRDGKAIHKIPQGWELVRKLPFSPAHLHKDGMLAAVDFCGHCGKGFRLLAAGHTGGPPARLEDKQIAAVLSDFEMAGAIEDEHPDRDPTTRLFQFEAVAAEPAPRMHLRDCPDRDPERLAIPTERCTCGPLPAVDRHGMATETGAVGVYQADVFHGPGGKDG